MADLIAPWLTASIGIPLAAAAVSRLPGTQRHARTIAVLACTASLMLSLETVRELIGAGWTTMSEPWVPVLFSADALNAVTMALFAALALVTLISAPRRDIDGKPVSTILMLTAGTLAAYAADNPMVFLAGWIGSLLPFLLGTRDKAAERRSVLELAASAVFLAVAVILHTSGASGIYAFTFLVLAAILRTGLFPFHRVAVSRFENGSLLPAGLLMNTHLGVFLIVRFGVPLFPAVAQTALPWLGTLALFTTIYTAVLGTVEREPRRLLALIFVSQSSAILAGLVTARPEGTMGGLVQWIVLGVTSTVMISICRCIEVRIDQPLAGERLLGLAAQMPRLAVFFVVSALALVGLPGTLGFPGEDLLVHGVLSAHPLIGIVLPVAIAINAYHLYRLFARLFLGTPVTAWNGAPDALPRERWPFSACLVILVWGGLMPSQVVALRSTAADLLATLTSTAALQKVVDRKP